MRWHDLAHTARGVLATVLVMVLGIPCEAQSRAADDRSTSDPALLQMLREMQGEIRELRQSVRELRDEAARYRAETEALRSQLQPAQVQPVTQGAAAQPGAQAPDTEEVRNRRLARVEEDLQLLTGKVDEQYQTKVESASKYRVRLFGIALLNLFENRGNVDNMDNPALAITGGVLRSSGSFGGTLRQSIVGLEVFGPQLAGARTTANIQFDFAGGFPQAENGVTFGLARLRTGTLRMDWGHTAVVAGQDGLFFAPLSPTSFASLSEPALAYAGDLWGWTPQLRVEHRYSFSTSSDLTFKAGILDALTGEIPPVQFYRQPNAGEKTGQPAYATRVSFTHAAFGKPLTIGAAGYYGRQDWGFDRNVNSWAVLSDWTVPLTQRFALSGEFYRGRAIGGFGGGVGTTVLANGPVANASTIVRGLNSAGGWAQLKFMPAPKIELNGAFGEDSPFAEDFRSIGTAQNYVRRRNQGALINLVAHPRSDLVFAVEYRHLRTFSFPRDSQSAHHFNVSMGVLF
jgi:hypothetical protein